jgi:hypothetical protein
VIGDMARIFVIVGGAILVGATLRALWESRAVGMSKFQIARFGALFTATISIIFTEVGRIHHVVTWRLPVNCAFITLGLFGVSGMLRHNRRRV